MMTDPLAAVRRALERPGSDTSDYDLNPASARPERPRLRAAGVLVPLRAGPGGVGVVLTKRSSRLRHHPGQIAFPGGKMDDSDLDPVAAALREAEEEIGLPREKVEILGTIPPHETVTGFSVTPVFGRIPADFEPVPEAGEVEEIFVVPLSHVTDPTRFRIEQRLWLGQARRYYTVPYGPCYIWGATARILKAFADRMTE